MGKVWGRFGEVLGIYYDVFVWIIGEGICGKGLRIIF